MADHCCAECCGAGNNSTDFLKIKSVPSKLKESS
jgi:hypothetical protein